MRKAAEAEPRGSVVPGRTLGPSQRRPLGVAAVGTAFAAFVQFGCETAILDHRWDVATAGCAGEHSPANALVRSLTIDFLCATQAAVESRLGAIRACCALFSTV